MAPTVKRTQLRGGQWRFSRDCSGGGDPLGVDGHLASVAVRCHAGDDGADEGSTRAERSDQFLLVCRELVPEAISQVHEHGRDDASVVAEQGAGDGCAEGNEPDEGADGRVLDGVVDGRREVLRGSVLDLLGHDLVLQHVVLENRGLGFGGHVEDLTEEQPRFGDDVGKRDEVEKSSHDPGPACELACSRSWVQAGGSGEYIDIWSGSPNPRHPRLRPRGAQAVYDYPGRSREVNFLTTAALDRASRSGKRGKADL